MMGSFRAAKNDYSCQGTPNPKPFYIIKELKKMLYIF